MKHLRLTLNLGGKPAERIRENGKWFLVAPVTMLVGDRVLNGSKGALYYPQDEVEKNPGAWNNVPITIGHPQYFGTAVSVKHSPAVRKMYEIGAVRSDRWDGRKRTALAWFDEAVTMLKAPTVYAALKSGAPMEVSTGLHTNDEAISGVAPDGQPFDAIARDYLPDHLAVLPNQRGACSNQDGCGLNVNALTPSHNCSRRTKMTRRTNNPDLMLDIPVPDWTECASPTLTGNCKKDAKPREQSDDLILEVPTTNWAEVAAGQDR